MAKITAQPTIDMTVTFSVSEAEARALDALVGYGDDAFIAAFKEKLGSAYIHDHEAALRSFFKDIRTLVTPLLSRIDDARRVFNPAIPRK